MVYGLTWNHLGEVATVAQLVGLDSIKLIGLIVNAANNARMHKKNCKQFAQHLKLIGNLLEQLKLSELKSRPETREPLEQLEAALRKAYVLVNSCKDRSYLYLLALGWTTVSHFKECQAEIDRLLGLIPLITLVDNNRERLKAIEKDTKVYTLDEEELKVHEAVMKTDVTKKDARILERSLSRSYPGLSLNEMLKEENNKLNVELQQVGNDLETDQVDVIHHILTVMESVFPHCNALQHTNSENHSKHFDARKTSFEVTKEYFEEDWYIFDQVDPIYYQEPDPPPPPLPQRQEAIQPSPTKVDSKPKESPPRLDKWHNSLIWDCCMDPYLCISTCMYPCGTFTDIAAFASGGKISPEDACNDLMTFSLLLSCCCYTCCYRKKLRKHYNIKGGCCEDFCIHVFCLYCALIQEWQEILYHDGEGAINISPPRPQKMARDG